MYAWIWRKLPFGLPGKLGGSVFLSLVAAALLWYVVFPAVDPYLPFNDTGVTSGEDGTINPNGPINQDNLLPAVSDSPSTSPSPASPSPTKASPTSKAHSSPSPSKRR
jgi:hypothetical protein